MVLFGETCPRTRAKYEGGNAVRRETGREGCRTCTAAGASDEDGGARSGRVRHGAESWWCSADWSRIAEFPRWCQGFTGEKGRMGMTLEGSSRMPQELSRRRKAVVI